MRLSPTKTESVTSRNFKADFLNRMWRGTACRFSGGEHGKPQFVQLTEVRREQVSASPLASCPLDLLGSGHSNARLREGWMHAYNQHHPRGPVSALR